MTWSSQSAPGGTGGLNVLSCGTTSVCLADNGSHLIDTTNGGSSWGTVSSLPGGAQPGPITCADATHCVVINDDSGWHFLSTTDGGSTWTSTAAPSPGRTIDDLACADDDDCFAMGEVGAGGEMICATDGIGAPDGGGITLPEVYAGLNKSESCFSCYLKKQGAAAQSFVGEPVNTATGDFYESLNLLSMPGRGIPISFTLSYDAEFAQAQVESGASSPGPDGWGWTDNYEMAATVDPTSDDVTVTQENGSQITFIPSTASACAGSYTASAPRIEASLACTTSGSNTIYTLTRNGGLLEDALTYNFVVTVDRGHRYRWQRQRHNGFVLSAGLELDWG